MLIYHNLRGFKKIFPQKREMIDAPPVHTEFVATISTQPKKTTKF